jgi:hypothetical protein
MIDMAVTDLPEPDSPTMPRHSPLEVHAVDGPVDAPADRELRLQARKPQDGVVAPRLAAFARRRRDGRTRDRTRQCARLQARVEHVAYAVAQQVDAHDEQEDDDARHDRDMRGVEQHPPAVAEHGAEVRLRRLGTEAEE